MRDTEHKRPEPESLLEIAQQEETAKKRGKLTIYFGAAPGVGKTYSMLSDARIRKKEGIDIVVGYVETHGRAETETLLEGLEIIPLVATEYKGVQLVEMDLESVLERQPRIVLVDELAHTNAPNSRHAKRYQDAEELLNAGIDVYSTLNVQHLESLNDTVFRIRLLQNINHSTVFVGIEDIFANHFSNPSNRSNLFSICAIAFCVKLTPV